MSGAPENIVRTIQAQAAKENLRLTQHGQQEMTEEEISLDELLEVLLFCELLENYPEHLRGACCLVLEAILKWGVRFTWSARRSYRLWS